MQREQLQDYASVVLLYTHRGVPLVFDPKRAKKRPGQPPYFKFPGGRPERQIDADPLDTAVREFRQETGIQNVSHRDLHLVKCFEKQSLDSESGWHTVYLYVGAVRRHLDIGPSDTGETLRIFPWVELTKHPEILYPHRGFAADPDVRRKLHELLQDGLPEFIPYRSCKGPE